MQPTFDNDSRNVNLNLSRALLNAGCVCAGATLPYLNRASVYLFLWLKYLFLPEIYIFQAEKYINLLGRYINQRINI